MQSKNKMIILRGLPASGKSTFAKQFILENPDYARVNRDDLRAMLFGMKFSSKNEDMVSYVCDLAILEAMKRNRGVIVDETSLNPKRITQLKKYADDHNYEFEIKEFDKDVELCILHDMTRPNPVGSKAIMQMYERYIAPNEKRLEYDPNKPKAIISDIDGTVAIIHHRSPYNTSLCFKDEPNHPVITSLKALKDKIIFVTGRDEKYRGITIDWLDKYFDNYELYMRPDDDKRSDYIVKQDITINKILPRYNVSLAYDDRPRNSRMYRKLGIQPIHVGVNAEW